MNGREKRGGVAAKKLTQNYCVSIFSSCGVSDAFSFETEGTKEKASQKENADMRGSTGTPKHPSDILRTPILAPNPARAF